MESENFIISDLDFQSKFLVELLFSSEFVLKIGYHKLELMASLVRLSDFYSPLVLIG